MSAIIKGETEAVLTRREPFFDSENKTYGIDCTYEGTQSAISGLEQSLQANNLTYRISNNGPVFALIYREILNNPDIENVDRWEISTESTDRSIWEYPTVHNRAMAYDAGVTTGDTYREIAERSVTEKTTAFPPPSGAAAIDAVVQAHLKGQAVGWQVDFVVLRRFRRVPSIYALGASGRMNLDVGLTIYSTSQLSLPADIAFALPSSPTTESYYAANWSWGWRRRSQRVEFIDNYVEQTIELVFAPWSTLFYSSASGNFSW